MCELRALRHPTQDDHARYGIVRICEIHAYNNKGRMLLQEHADAVYQKRGTTLDAYRQLLW
eukprot:CAMPEP_0184382122 /NCGR_PEP_ID=MMETSP0007-20130409/6084_1 /TAXON_ID=97485 /ORGANISM="Prymnesium parvum, Strain Texoma1" /LENGTH=60 /DNA_ID=CAMNT_0026728031 /DNA_START=174 /DNA_END=353 /DNA_ORIENTATION=-